MEPTSPSQRYRQLHPSIQEYIKRAADRHLVRPYDLLEHNNRRKVVAARVEVMQWLRTRGYSFPGIAAVFGMNHTTVMHHLEVKTKPATPFPDESGIWAI